MLLIINPALISMPLPYVYLKVTILYLCALTSSSRSFHHLLPPSRPMISHHVTCHVTAVSCASSSSKRKEKENKIPIKSENKRKENKNKNYSCSKRPITS